MLPNPADALTNPMRYWADVWAFQFKMGKVMYEAAAAMNPLLPQISLEAHLDTAPARPARRAQPEPAPASATIEHLPAPAKPAPARKPRRKAAPATAKVETVPAAEKVEAKPAPGTRAKPAAKPARKPAAKTAARKPATSASRKPAASRRRAPAKPAKPES